MTSVDPRQMANAIRFRGCAGQVNGRAKTSYCPECRRALEAWCHSTVAARAEEWLARLILRDLFGTEAAA